MPPSLASYFTVGELAVLRIVADDVAANGQCVKSIAEIAARAGVCRTTAQNAIREAARQGLLVVQERRREGRRNEFATLSELIDVERAQRAVTRSPLPSMG
jgi:transposase